MGVNISIEAVILEAVSKSDTRKLRECFSHGNHSPLLLLATLSQEQLDDVHDPTKDPKEAHKQPYQKLLGMSPAQIAAEQTDARILHEIINVVNGTHDDKLQVLRWGGADALGQRLERARYSRLTPLSMAVRTSNAAAVKVLREASSSNESDRSAPTTWAHRRYCAENGFVDVPEVLMEQGADNESWGKDSRRAIRHVVEAGQLECVKVLLDHDKPDESDSDAAQSEKRIRAIPKYVVRECSIPYAPKACTEIGAATAAGVPFAPDGDAPVPQQQEQHGDMLSALQVALQDTIRGMTISAPRATTGYRSNRDRGASLLHLACSRSHPDVLSHMLSRGEFRIALEEMNDSGKSPIFMAIQHGSLECLKLLVNASAEVDSKNVENWTALHEAVKG